MEALGKQSQAIGTIECKREKARDNWLLKGSAKEVEVRNSDSSFCIAKILRVVSECFSKFFKVIARSVELFGRRA